MAISRNLYTRGLAQRLAGAVWYQRQGQTLVRELAPHVTNPQSNAQMEQRVKLANLVAIYRANRAWMDKYSFEGKPQTWSDYNAFVSANLKNNDIYLEKSNVAAGAAVVAPYIFTRGTLPSIGLSWIAGNEVYKTDLYTGDLSIPSGDSQVTVAQLSAALIENNNGLKEGDQISFIQNIQRTGSNGEPFVTLRFNEIIIDTTDPTKIADRIGADVILTDEYSGLTCLCMAPAEDSSVVGGLICLSRNEGGQIKVSSQVMVVNDDTYADDYKDIRRAIRSYADGVTEPFLVPVYNGGTEDSPIELHVLFISDGTTSYTSSTPVPLEGAGSTDFRVVMSSPVPPAVTISRVVFTLRTSQTGTETINADDDLMRIVDGVFYVGSSQWPEYSELYLAQISIETSIGTFTTPEYPWGGEISG